MFVSAEDLNKPVYINFCMLILETKCSMLVILCGFITFIKENIEIVINLML